MGEIYFIENLLLSMLAESGRPWKQRVDIAFALDTCICHAKDMEQEQSVAFQYDENISTGKDCEQRD